jgi:hypothetical protein
MRLLRKVLRLLRADSCETRPNNQPEQYEQSRNKPEHPNLIDDMIPVSWRLQFLGQQ